MKRPTNFTNEFVYREAMAGLERQQRAMDSYRTQAATLFAGAAVVTTLLAAPLVDAGSLGYAGLGALVVFALLVTALGLVLADVRWELGVKPNFPYEAVEMDDVLNELRRQWEANHGRVRVRRAIFQAAIALLCAETILWLLEYGSRAVAGAA